ncbi:hypothetical protein EXN00_09715 [Clostridium botulinum]|nr:hypothetical protein RSJ22_14155 [Clostridium botulinum]KON09804.1 hypothetical protein ACP52_09035 [Clostridium botulinum]MBN3411197.1 hypothetical protein [Clostridium botulinum]MBN3418611.1 hypothetical protein [Clostridium botulinum]MBN3426121.1 hypothetical protein [Clostridium botulinum]
MIKIKKLINKFKQKLFIADMLLIISVFIIFFTTFLLNKYIAMYLLSLFFFGVSYLIQKNRR